VAVQSVANKRSDLKEDACTRSTGHPIGVCCHGQGHDFPATGSGLGLGLQAVSTNPSRQQVKYRELARNPSTISETLCFRAVRVAVSVTDNDT